jgi:hypothetical protein
MKHTWQEAVELQVPKMDGTDCEMGSRLHTDWLTLVFSSWVTRHKMRSTCNVRAMHHLGLWHVTHASHVMHVCMHDSSLVRHCVVHLEKCQLWTACITDYLFSSEMHALNSFGLYKLKEWIFWCSWCFQWCSRHHHNGRWEARIGRVFGNKYLYLGTFGMDGQAVYYVPQWYIYSFMLFALLLTNQFIPAFKCNSCLLWNCPTYCKDHLTLTSFYEGWST